GTLAAAAVTMGCLAPYAKYRCDQERLHQPVNSSHGFLAPTAEDSSSISGVVRLSGGVRSDCENPAERTAVRSERPRSDRESGEDHRRDEIARDLAVQNVRRRSTCQLEEHARVIKSVRTAPGSMASAPVVARIGL